MPNCAFASSVTGESIIDLTNKERLENGVKSLKTNPVLTQAAENKGKFLMEKGIFTHNTQNRTFSDWVKDVGYDYKHVGENLAIDFSNNKNVINAWLDSPGHKKNLLSPKYKEIGVAVLEGEFKKKQTYLVVQIFGTKDGVAKPQVASVDKQGEIKKDLEVIKDNIGVEEEINSTHTPKEKKEISQNTNINSTTPYLGTGTLISQADSSNPFLKNSFLLSLSNIYDEDFYRYLIFTSLLLLISALLTVLYIWILEHVLK